MRENGPTSNRGRERNGGALGRSPAKDAATYDPQRRWELV